MNIRRSLDTAPKERTLMVVFFIKRREKCMQTCQKLCNIILVSHLIHSSIVEILEIESFVNCYGKGLVVPVLMLYLIISLIANCQLLPGFPRFLE